MAQGTAPYGHPESELHAGIRVGPYQITKSLGHGSMGSVYLARDRTGHEVALKLFKEGSGISATMLERFRREAEATKKLRRHPYILTVYDAGQEGPYHYIVMENVAGGRTFEDVMESGTPLEELLRLINKIATALDYAHEHGIVHRDVKPTNILIDDFGEPLLSDFGVADLVDWPSCTVSGALTGTPMYMSPEQARADKVDRRSDIYSLGVVLYEAACGAIPYELSHGPVTKDVLEAVKTQKVPRLRSRNRKVSRDLDYVVMKALAKSPVERYPSAKAFAQDLECVLEGRPVKGRLFTPYNHARHFFRRNRSILLVLGFSIAASAVAGLYYFDVIRTMNAEQLLTLARQRDLELRLSTVERPPQLVNPPSRSGTEIRLARKDMELGNIFEARNRLQAAATVSAAYRDERTASLARLEQARCEILLDNSEHAAELYESILDAGAASLAVSALAHFELLVLLEFNRDQDGRERLLRRHAEKLDVGPFPRFLQCLTGAMQPEPFKAMIIQFPEHFQNDAYLALAVRRFREGDLVQARSDLRTCIRTSSPKPEWPAPLAQYYLTKLQEQP